MPLCYLVHPEWDLLPSLLWHLGYEAMLRRGGFVPPSGAELSQCGGPQPELFLLSPDISFLHKHLGRRAEWERWELCSRCWGGRSVLYVLPTAQACRDSPVSCSGDSFEQVMLFLLLGDQEAPSHEPHFAVGGRWMEKWMLFMILIYGFFGVSSYFAF